MSPRYLFDTDTCIYWLKGDADIEKRVAEMGLEHIGLTAITLCELYYGAFKSDRKKGNLETIENLVKKLLVIPADRKSAPFFGEIKADLEKAGRALDDADLLIASVALAHGAVLVTNNASHFNRISNLAIETWGRP